MVDLPVDPCEDFSLLFSSLFVWMPSEKYFGEG